MCFLGNLQTIGGGGLIMVPGQVVPTLPSGGTPPPGTGGTSWVAPSLSKWFDNDILILNKTPKILAPDHTNIVMTPTLSNLHLSFF